MKKENFFLIPLTVFLMSCTSSSQPAPISGGMTLDQAIAEASERIDERIQSDTKIAPLNFNSASDRFSAYVLDELTANLVDSGKLTVVDRSEIDLIRSEFDFQYSGDVADDSMQALGRMLGAQSIISGSLTDMGGFYRIVIRVLNVQNASVEVQYRANIINDNIVAALLTGGRTNRTAANSGGTVSSNSSGQVAQLSQPATQKSTPVVNTPPPSITGTIVPGESLAEKLAWLERSADSHNTYIIEVTANENIAPHTFNYQGAINITVVLRGIGENRTIRLRSNGTMFTVNNNVTLILDNNITIQGHNQNNRRIVIINGGIFKMNEGSIISGNNGGGVSVWSGTFEMIGGIISNNTFDSRDAYVGGGGIYIGNASFIMNGGTITGNTGYRGGGIFISGGTFTMSNGAISDNTALGYGGGIWLQSPGTRFVMSGGIITRNTALNSGGGVYGISFTKNGGTITGYNSDSINGNVVKDEAGNIIARKGHAVYINESMRRETTAGPGINLSSNSNGGWDN